MRHAEIQPTFESWQEAARELLRDGVPPDAVTWREAAAPAAAAPAFRAPRAPDGGVRVPRRFVELARHVAGHGDPARWRMLYEMLWRIVHERRDLLDAPHDPLVGRLLALERGAGEAPAADRPAPAPVEAPPIGATSFVPAGAGLAELAAAAARCTGCDLHRHATQTVFGRGPADARIVMVGEQPGDQEDRQGAPFVGPAGEVFDRALAEVGLARERIYVTNAVKHFSFVARGPRRIHQTPRTSEIAACRPWVEAELAVLHPEVLVCLGATAARALIGAEFRITRDRGRFIATRWAARTMATYHPSAVLRGEDATAQAELYGMLVADLRLVAAA